MKIINMPEPTQYLTFYLDEDIYAINILKIREVIDFTKVIKVPQMPKFMRGVINRSGKIFPVVDLCLKFGLTKTERTINTCIIIVEIRFNNKNYTLGVLADSVDEVMEIRPEHIEPIPKIGTAISSEFIRGISRYNEEFIMLLDIDNVFSSNELILVKDSVKYNWSEEPETAA